MSIPDDDMELEEETSTPDYTMGFSEEMLSALRRYTVERNAAHLVPYLRPGLRLLDFGCGPGTISVGLAKAVDPGEMHGVDMEASQIEQARNVALLRRQSNAVYHVGDVANLQFEDNYFDVAHCHNVLMHVPDTQAVLTEVMRVLKPGGIISCREMICESSFTHPHYGVMDKSWEIFEDLLAADDGHPQIGKELKTRLTPAGFENIRLTMTFEIYNSPEDIAFIHAFAHQWFLAPEIAEAAIKYGAATRELFDQIGSAYDRWRENPGAFCALAFGEAIANKP